MAGRSARDKDFFILWRFFVAYEGYIKYTYLTKLLIHYP
jgi:hypothetical protein